MRRTNKIGACATAAVIALLSVSADAADASGSSPSPEHGAPAAPSSETVRLGSSGYRVLQVQYVLRSLGHQISVDGVFGKRTEAAVKSFQASRRLKADGIVGPATAAALGLSGTPATVATPAAAPATPPAPAPAPAPAPGSYRHPNAKVERWHSAALGAGWAEDDWPRLSCIINRESGGDPAARNASSATGLLQIMWSVHSKWIGGSSTQLTDGPTNLRLGRQLFIRSGGWWPWKSTVNGC